MNLFDERTRALETKYAHELEIEFLTKARTNGLVGRWVASILRFSDDQSKKYAAELVEKSVERVEMQELVNKVLTDLRNGGEHVSRRQVNAKIDEMHFKAKHDIQTGVK